jgi:hypothetical protein
MRVLDDDPLSVAVEATRQSGEPVQGLERVADEHRGHPSILRFIWASPRRKAATKESR